jgi:hypothetical protein
MDKLYIPRTSTICSIFSVEFPVFSVKFGSLEYITLAATRLTYGLRAMGVFRNMRHQTTYRPTPRQFVSGLQNIVT